MKQCEVWLADQPRDEVTGKVDGRLLVQESKRLGYCVCPRALRQMVNFAGLRCMWCEQPETEASWAWWYADVPG